MAWRYHCGTCQVTTGLMGRVDVEAARSEHRKAAHHGLTPSGEEISSNAEPANLMAYAWFFGGCIVLWIIDNIFHVTGKR